MRAIKLSAPRSPHTAILAVLLVLGCFAPAWAQTRDSMLQFQLSDQLKKSAALWNKGDLKGFMVDYLPSEELTFTSGGRVLRGFDALRDRYEKSYGENLSAMGQLSFSDVEVWRLAEDQALVLGRWRLDHKDAAEKSTENGVFSLNLVKLGTEWKIFHDHTSLSVDR